MNYMLAMLAAMWSGVNIICFANAIGKLFDREYKVISPRYIYKSTKLNWIAVWIVFMLYLIGVVGYTLPYLIYWLCHIGRKD